jgi:hypothetical protein
MLRFTHKGVGFSTDLSAIWLRWINIKNNIFLANIFIAFQRDDLTKVEVSPNYLMNPLFEATVQSVEEAIVNALVAAETMEGVNVINRMCSLINWSLTC